MHTNNTTYNRSKPRTPQRRPVKNTKRSESVIIHEDNDAHGNASSTEDQSGDEVSEDSVERFSPHLNLLSRLLCSTSTTEQRVAEVCFSKLVHIKGKLNIFGVVLVV